jgi:N-acetylmuramoyl-L-alanine amidase
LFLDFKNSRLKKGIDKKLPINDNLLIDTRAGQYTPDSVRVVIDIKSFENYRIFSQEDPFRVVVDVWGKALRKKENEKKGTVPEKTIHPAVRKTKQKEPGSDLIRQLSLGVSRIVIDPGHGGRDAGAVGYNDKILEKDVVLHIAKTLARRIRKRIGCEVILTRQTDRFLSLEERTAIANTREADLFISVHTNAHKDKRAYGIETYHLDLATDEEAVRVAAMENATSKNNISDLEKILAGLMQNANQNESGILASLVQNSMCERLEKRYKRIRNKGVKEAPFYVLMGARMPSVLIETSFISNRRECNRLTNSTYVNNLCEGIVEGIIRYIKETKPTALKGGNQNFGG